MPVHLRIPFWLRQSRVGIKSCFDSLSQEIPHPRAGFAIRGNPLLCEKAVTGRSVQLAGQVIGSGLAKSSGAESFPRRTAGKNFGRMIGSRMILKKGTGVGHKAYGLKPKAFLFSVLRRI
jgi:hypothetical protein